MSSISAVSNSRTGLTVTPGSLADWLQRQPPSRQTLRTPGAQPRRWQLASAVVMLLSVLWAACVPLSGAVVAPAEVAVELHRQVVQHADGGVLTAVMVREGEAVRAGQPLMVVADVRRQAELDLQQSQLRAARAKLARAEAETAGADHVALPELLRNDSRAEEAMSTERAAFDARRQAVLEQSALLQQQIAQTEAQVTALQTQIEATRESGRLSREELALNEDLAREGFVSRTRVIALKRAAVETDSRVGEQSGELAAGRQRIAELRTRQAQIRLSYRTQAAEERIEAAARIREIEEKLRPSRDQIERDTVRAPVDGQVMSLRLTAPGAVVAPRENLLELVPQHDALIVTARISPQDIEHVHAGGAARVRLLSSDARLVPPLAGRVTRISPDRVLLPDGRSHFEVAVTVDADALRQHPEVQLRPGLPAELDLVTGEHTLLQYLARPVLLFWQHALREPR